MCPLRPADADARERLGYKELVPRTHLPCSLRLQVKCADRRAGCLRQLDWSHLGLVDRSAWAVRREDRRPAGLNDPIQAQQSYMRASRARSAHRVEPEHPEDACDELAIKTAADQDYGAGTTKVHGAGKHALMPEAVDLRSGLLAEDNGGHTILGDDFKPPCDAGEPKQRPHQTRHHSQHNSLAQCNSEAGFGSHFPDFSCSAASERFQGSWRVSRT